MFTWICPKCGAEVPPAYDDCPRCSAQTAQSTAAETRTAAPAESVAAPQSVPAAPPPPPVYVAPPAAASPTPAARPRTLPPSLVALLAGVGIAGVLAVLYLYVLPRTNAGETAESAPRLEQPAPVGSATSTHPLAKHLELAGVRIMETSGNRVRVQFLVVNHSAADLPPMKMDVALRSADQNVFDFPVELPSLGPYESKELSATVATTLKPYELPDWQVVRPAFRLLTQP